MLKKKGMYLMKNFRFLYLLVIPMLMPLLLVFNMTSTVHAFTNKDSLSHACTEKDYTKNYEYVGQTNKSIPGTENSFSGPSSATISRSVTLSDTWGVSITGKTSLQAVEVTAGVKYDETLTRTIQLQYSVPVPAGKVYTVFADEVDDTYVFEVWRHSCSGPDRKLGPGWTDIYSGVHYGWFDQDRSDVGIAPTH